MILIMQEKNNLVLGNKMTLNQGKKIICLG